MTSKKFPPLKIKSFAEMVKHEKEIVARIAATKNGGNLFMLHPFMLLADVGVELSNKAQKEILRQEPHLAALSPTPYLALKKSEAKQEVRFRVHGLFRRRSA